MDKIVLGVLAAIFAVHGAATWFSWYYIFWWFDIPMHIVCGAWLALLFFYLFRDRLKVLSSPGFIATLFLALGFVSFIGVGWEIYEYLVSVFVAKKIPFGGSGAGDYFDTLKDLLDDVFGGFVATCLVYWHDKRSQRNEHLTP